MRGGSCVIYLTARHKFVQATICFQEIIFKFHSFFFLFFLRYTEFEGSLKIMTWNLFSGDEQNVERIDSWVKRRRHVCDFINSLKPDVSNFSIFSSFSFFKSKYLMTEHKIYNQKIFVVAWITYIYVWQRFEIYFSHHKVDLSFSTI